MMKSLNGTIQNVRQKSTLVKITPIGLKINNSWFFMFIYIVEQKLKLYSRKK